MHNHNPYYRVRVSVFSVKVRVTDTLAPDSELRSLEHDKIVVETSKLLLNS